MLKGRNFIKKEILFILTIVITILILYNYLNFSENRWTLHPDDQNIFIFSNVLLETGHLWYQSSLNDVYKTTAFVPSISDFQSSYSESYKIRAAYSPGIYFLTCLGNLFGFRGPFIIISIFGVIGILFFYFFVKEIYGFKIATVATFFLGFSAPYIYWSNMLFTNIPALSLFLGGFFYLAKSINYCNKRRYYLFSISFFTLSLWVRPDFIFLVCISSFIIFFRHIRKLNRKYILQSLFLLSLFGSLLAFINYVTTESFIGIYPTVGIGAQISELFVKYPTRMFDIRVLYVNINMYIYSMAPFLTIFAIFGIVFCLKNKRNTFSHILLIIAIFVLYYYGKNNGFWGYNKNWFASSYTRYFLPLFMCLSVFAGVFINRFIRTISNKKLAVMVNTLILLIYLITSVGILSKSRFGLNYTDVYNGNRKAVDSFVSTLPKNSVIVDVTDGWYKYMILSRTVLIASKIPEAEREETLPAIVDGLIKKDNSVYVIDNPDRAKVNLENLIINNSYTLVQIQHPIRFRVGGKSPVIYKIE